MSIEDFPSSLENQKVVKRKKKKLDKLNESGPFRFTQDQVDEIEEWERNKKNKNEEGISRRSFLKLGAAALGAVTTGVGIKELLGSEEDEEKKEKKKINEKEAMTEESSREKEIRIENLADHFLLAYNELSRDSEKFPGDIFEEDLLIAQQCQESRGKIDAKSHSGALGVMQNMEASIVDVTKYLNKLQRNTDFSWSGPEKLSEDDVADLKDLLIEKSDYSRAFGKIYLMQLWDDNYGYSVGRKRYSEGNLEETQIELMGAYNAGFSRIKNKKLDEWKRLRDFYKDKKDEKSQKEYRAYNEAIIYVDRVMNYKQRILNIRHEISEMDVVFDSNEDYAVRQIALKLDYITGVRGEERARKLREETRGYLSDMKNINIHDDRGPSYQEIDKIVSLE